MPPYVADIIVSRILSTNIGYDAITTTGIPPNLGLKKTNNEAWHSQERGVGGGGGVKQL